MSRPFRFHPPDVDEALLRREVQRSLITRFDRRVLVVEAGAGFGKTTSLAQAVVQNRLAPRGEDVWLTCEPADRDAGQLVQSLAHALGLSDVSETTDLVAEIARRAPVEVCLILDDVHDLGDESNGLDTLAQLVVELPANGHLVLASRYKVPLALERLRAQGRVESLTERDLALSGAEIDELGGTDLSGTKIADVQGWPALVSLALRAGDHRRFLDEEVLSRMVETDRALLRYAVALGTLDDDLALHLVGSPADGLGNVPLVHHDEGFYEPHDLWSEVAGAQLDATEVDVLVQRAVEFLIEDQRAPQAIDLCLQHGHPLLGRALRAGVVLTPRPDPDNVRRQAAAIPAERRNEPEAAFTRGLALLLDDPTAAECHELFESARKQFEIAGDRRAEVSALARLGFWHHVQRSVVGLGTVAKRVVELAELGVDDAIPYTMVGAALIGMSMGDSLAMRSAIGQLSTDGLPPEYAAMVDWLDAQALEMAGYRSVEAADRCTERQVPLPGVSIIWVSSRWRAGELEDLLAEPDHLVVSGQRDVFLSSIWLGIVAAGTGDLARARSLLEAADAAAGSRSAPQVGMALRILEAFIAQEAGDRDTAIAIAEALVDEHPLSSATRSSYTGTAGMFCRFRPENEEFYRAASTELGPILERDLSLARAMADLDRTGDVAAVADTPWPRGQGGLIAALGLRGAVEFVVAAWAAGRDEVADAIEWLTRVIGEPVRTCLRALADDSRPVIAQTAAEILSQIPVAPTVHTRVRLFGPSTIQRGDTDIDDPDWRRENVRALFGFLVVNPNTTRDQIMAALWPDADEQSARRSLRTVLNLLHRTLEPERAGGDATFYIRADRSAVRLVRHPTLSVDAWEFDRLIDDAEAKLADGVPSLAVEPLLGALELYQGDFLAGVPGADWHLLDRDRYVARFVAAAVRAAELCSAYGRVDDALTAAQRALAVEPWSEPAHRALIAAHLANDDRASARRALERAEAELAEFGGISEEPTKMLIRRLG